MPYILNVWVDMTGRQIEVHLYRANHSPVVVLATLSDAIKYLWRIGEVEVWAFDRAGALCLYRIDWMPAGAVAAGGFPLPDILEDREPAARPLGGARRRPPQFRPLPGRPETFVQSLRPRQRPFQRLLRPRDQRRGGRRTPLRVGRHETGSLTLACGGRLRRCPHCFGFSGRALATSAPAVPTS